MDRRLNRYNQCYNETHYLVLYNYSIFWWVLPYMASIKIRFLCMLNGLENSPYVRSAFDLYVERETRRCVDFMTIR